MESSIPCIASSSAASMMAYCWSIAPALISMSIEMLKTVISNTHDPRRRYTLLMVHRPNQAFGKTL
jgi:hypothetical protein